MSSVSKESLCYYRPDVQKMLAVGEEEKAKKEKFKFKFNTGLDYYPFQRWAFDYFLYIIC